ncbi:acyltransferase [Ferrovibrio terrae]|uniref:Acyltransferase n=2 Tax=Ferrovibrio terrae TaxID=2594003 RepID=A0A516H0A5_9PROT|nr:acyltransferase [Ferrovibrio terrae]
MAAVSAKVSPHSLSSLRKGFNPGKAFSDMQRIQYLDGLRGWAALFVLFHHLLLAFAPDGRESALHTSPVSAPLGFLTDGPLAVAIFFILSGIVLTAAVTSAQERGLHLRLGPLLVKRWLRLGIPIFVAGLLVLALFTVGLDRSIAIGWASESSFMRSFFPPGYDPSLLLVLKEAFIASFLGPTPPHDPVLWTIRIEFAGSVLVFLLALLLPAGRLRLAAAVVTGVALAVVPADWPSRIPLGWIGNYCALFALGVALFELLRLHHQRGGRNDPWRDAFGFTLLALGLVLYPLFGIRVYDVAAIPPVIGEAPLLGGSQLRAVLVVAGVLLSPSLQLFLSNATSAFLGRVSFGLYLLHAPLIWSAGGLAYFPLAARLGHWPAALLAALAVIVLSLCAAALFHQWVEQPSMRLSARAAALAAMPGRLFRRPLFRSLGRGSVGRNLELLPVAARRNPRHPFE